MFWSQAHDEPERYLRSIPCVRGGSAAGYGGSTGSVLDPGTQSKPVSCFTSTLWLWINTDTKYLLTSDCGSSRNLTELKVSAGEPSRILTIRTEPDHATQLLDHLLARVLNQEFAPESRDHYRKEPREEPQEELEGESGSSEADPQDYTAACLLNRGGWEYWVEAEDS